MIYFNKFIIHYIVFSIISMLVIVIPIFIFDYILKYEDGSQKSWLMIFNAIFLVVVVVAISEKKHMDKNKMVDLINTMSKPFTFFGVLIWVWLLLTIATSLVAVVILARRVFELDFNMMGYDSFLTFFVVFYGATFFLKSINSAKNEAG